MRYRAILNDPGNATAERPTQTYGNSRTEIDRWAQIVLNSAVAPNAAVSVFETFEQQVAIIVKPKPEKPIA